MKIDANHKKNVIRLLEIILLMEFLFKIDNKIVQLIGLLLLPVMFFYVYLIVKI